VASATPALTLPLLHAAFRFTLGSLHTTWHEDVTITTFSGARRSDKAPTHLVQLSELQLLLVHVIKTLYVCRSLSPCLLALFGGPRQRSRLATTTTTTTTTTTNNNNNDHDDDHGRNGKVTAAERTSDST
jgi:hypothetical protein